MLRGLIFAKFAALVAEVKVAVSSSSTVAFDNSVFDSGNGACDIAQQKMFTVETHCVGRVPISILSHWD